jgi:formate C-acetyltransferase
LRFTTGETWERGVRRNKFSDVPEVYSFFQRSAGRFKWPAIRLSRPKDFYSLSIAERRAWLMKEAIVNRVPQEILPGDLIAGGRFNVMASRCWSKQEAKRRNDLLLSKEGIRKATFEFQDRGYGNCGATSGHLIPDYPRILKDGFSGVKADLEAKLNALTPAATRQKGGSAARDDRELRHAD